MPLSNTTQQVLKTTPYFDDYYKPNTATGLLTGVDFDFHRVLFRPRFGVQARELTQLQTLLQVQLERLGGAQFSNGDRVFGGQLTIDVGAVSAQVLANTTLTNFFDRDTNEGTYVFSTTTTTTKAKVTQYVGVDDGETSNNYLILKYQTADVFEASDVIQDRDSNATATIASGAAFSDASTISIDEGVCFVSGMFARIRPQTIVLDALSNRPSYRIGLNITEEILDELDDVVGDSLGDPANQSAPGAHRLRVRLTLAKKSLSTSADDSFIELCRVIDGAIITNRPNSKFVTMRELESILARRTYDESGDYMIRPFSATMEGAPTANSTNSTDTDSFMLALGAGKAYVRGHEIETATTNRLVIDKARSSVNVDSSAIGATVGNYVFVTRFGGLSNTAARRFFSNATTVELHSVPVSSINVSSNTTYNYSRIGTTRVRMMEVASVPDDVTIYSTAADFINDTNYKLFFFNTTFDTFTGVIDSASTSATNNKTSLVITAPVNGFPLVNNALNGVSIVLGGASSGIYTIETYTSGVSTVTLLLKEYLTTTPANGTSYRLMFQPRDIDAFAYFDAAKDMASPFTSNLAFQADVAVASKTNRAPDGYTVISDPNDNSLLYQINESFIVPDSLSPDGVRFSTWLSSANATSTTGVANDNITLTFDDLQDYLNLPTGTGLSAAAAAESFIVFDITDDTSGRGRLLNFSDGANTTARFMDNVAVTDTQLSFTYHHGGNIASTRTFMAFGKAEVVGVPPRTKDYYIGNTTHALANTTGALFAGQVEYYTLNTASGFAYSLKTPDVINLRKVLYKSSNTAFSNTEMSTATDVTEYFTLDNGQRDNTYEYAQCIVERGLSSLVSASGRLLFIFDWFNHSGVGYSYIDSYLSTNNQEKGFTYEDIPSYTSPKFHNTINLRYAIDFRPARSNKEWLTSTLVLASSNTSTNGSYLTNETSPRAYVIPVSDGTWTGGYAYYLSRIDRILLSQDKAFYVKQGDSAVRPTPPAIDADAIVLYELFVPAYTLVDEDGVPVDVKIRPFDYRRFTMKDLAKVEDRVARLEYYTALSQLERNARNQSILDIDNQERFKNGILVDSFINGAVGDVSRADWAAAIDTRMQVLYPTFRYAGDVTDATGPLQYNFSRDVANSTTIDMTFVGSMAIPNYTRDAMITQPLATRSISVNPFNIRDYRGTIALAPAVDTGKSLAPARVLETGPDQAWINVNYPSYTVWNEWQATWGGSVDVRAGSPRTFFQPNVPNWDPNQHPAGAITAFTYQDIQTFQTFSRQGTQFNFESVSSGTQSLGNITIDSYVIHNIRQRDVAFAANGLKPNTAIYPFFDGRDVQAYTQQANALRLEGIAAADIPDLRMGDTVFVKKALTGTVTIAAGANTISGSSTLFDYELLPGQLVEIVKGTDTYLRYIGTQSSNTAATLASAAPNLVSVTGATLYTITPVTIADFAVREYANTTTNAAEAQITLKVVRVNRDGEIAALIPYTIQAGSLSPTQLVSGNTATNGASVLMDSRVWRTAASFNTYAETVDSTAGTAYASLDVTAASIHSGVVRGYSSAAHTLRLDLDAPASANTDIPAGTVIYFVNGDAAGQSANVVSYNAATQTVTLDSGSTLTGITAGVTIYSIDGLYSDGVLPSQTTTNSGYPTGSLGASGVTGYAGTAAGALHIQNDQFPVGARVFRLIDDADNNAGSATSRAEGSYVASGTVTVDQPTSLTTRVVVPRTQVVSDTTTELVATRTELVDINYVDPIAQSFLVPSSVYPQGVFLESIDIVFSQKPQASDESEVVVEIRPMVNGYPSSSEVVPCVSAHGLAVATRRPASVNVSATPSFDDSSVFTRFTFPALVHLLPGSEYAIVVRSNSDEYKVYTAQMNETVIGTTNIVGAQPYAGSFFKSQNASTWTAEQSEDMMFRINRATWTVGQTGRLVLRAVPFAANTTFDSLTLYAHDINFGALTSIDYTAHIFPMNEETEDLTGMIAEPFTVYTNQTLRLPARAITQGIPATSSGPNTTANTIDLVASFTTNSVDVAPFIDLAKINAVGVRHMINDMPLQESQFEIVTPGDSYANSAASTGTVTTNIGSTTVTGSGTTFTSTLVVGRDVVIGGNLAFTVATIDSDVQFTTTTAVTESRSANTYAVYPNVEITISASDVGTDAEGYAIAKAISTSNVSGYISAIVLTQNGSGYITSPTITVNTSYNAAGTDAVVVYRGEDWLSGGNGLTRYITKAVTLADGFEARDLKVYFDAVRPYGTNFYVYYRILPASEDTASLDQQSWRLMSQTTSDSVISVLADQYREFEFSTMEGTASDATTDTTDRFKVYAIKIVMASNDTTLLPSVKNFRAIALDS